MSLVLLTLGCVSVLVLVQRSSGTAYGALLEQVLLRPYRVSVWVQLLSEGVCVCNQTPADHMIKCNALSQYKTCSVGVCVL